MLTYPIIDPIALSLGPLDIHWYGIMYLLGFGCFLWLGTRRAKLTDSGWTPEQVSDLLFYGAMGVILGGRMGYVLFYKFSEFMQDPVMLMRIWEGGMAFHGGLLGVVIGAWFFGRKYDKSVVQVTDFCAPMIPIGLGAGRLGNFINGELWGKVTDLPWAVVFPHAGPDPRHPSQLYQACLEGLVLFVVLWLFSSKSRPRMAVSSLFLLLYGVFRFVVEFVRLPDAHLGYLAFGWLTMGQVLSLPMIILGAVLPWWSYNRQQPVSA